MTQSVVTPERFAGGMTFEDYLAYIARPPRRPPARGDHVARRAARRPDPATGGPGANHDLMLEFMNAENGGEWASVPVAVVYATDFRELHRYIEYPAIYEKDRIRRCQQAVQPGESAEQARERGMREFAAMQASPFFDMWASAGVDEILSGIYEKLTVGQPDSLRCRAGSRALDRSVAEAERREGAAGA